MNTNEAIHVIARWSMWQTYETWAEREDLWEGWYPEFGESDVAWILEVMEKSLPDDVTVERVKVAYKVLADRAAGAEI